MRLFYFLAFVGFIFTSCQKESLQEETLTKKSEVTYEEFHQDLQMAMASAGDDDMIEVQFDAASGNYVFYIDDLPIDPPPMEVRCEGSGISFARCVKDAVDTYGCQQITSDGDDGYISEDCP